jgi:putative membrane protein insertion efficiency factor
MKRHRFATTVCGTLIGYLCIVIITSGDGYTMEFQGTESAGVKLSDEAPDVWGPWDGTAWDVPARVVQNSEEGHFRISHILEVSAIGMIRFFQKYISPVDGPSCSFYPTCSSYGMEAIKKQGVLIGIPMTAERIMRNHRVDNPDRYRLIEISGTPYQYDPIEANDFWWHSDMAHERSMK